jgi:hypothetical protein
MEQAIADVVKEIEEEKALGRISGVSVFRNMLNQPALMSVSSVNAQPQESGDGFSSFTIDLPRPLLSIKAMEMLTCNMPLCTQNIPDTACAFWYYRLSLYSGKYPNANNLFWVRLLPSYYKPEFVRNFENYGYNKTFDGYSDVATQLALSTTQDLAQINFDDSDAGAPYYRIQYLPDDEVKLTYDSAINKFQFAGNFGLPYDGVTDRELIVTEYNAGYTYPEDYIVKDTVYVQGWGFLCYKSLVAGNIGHALPVYPVAANAYWARDYNVEGVAEYSGYTAYKTGQFVAANGILYKCSPSGVYSSEVGSFGNLPTNTDYWAASPVVTTNTQLYTYLATGPADPDVAFMQADSQRKWSQYALYEEQDNVIHNGVTYKAYTQTLGTEPFPVPNATANAYSALVSYKVGDWVYYNNRYYINILDSKGNAPTGAYTNNTWWAFIEYDPAKTNYQVGDVITYVGFNYVPFWRCIKSFPPANNLAGAGAGARFGTNAYWQPSYWSTGTSSTLVPYVGLAKISSQFDMLDDLNGSIQYPFPEGIPPQPFAQTPKRLLNSILGFTWNGKFTPSMLSVIYDQVPVSGSTTVTQLLNRLRPVPLYISYALLGTSAADSVNLDPTLTAAGYGNLVYSSVINVYATIAGAKSLDTQRNTNLIGTMTASAGNLGIAFAASYIDTPLDQYEGDIYSINFEFRDECGELYPFTNNAVVSMTFRMRYKSDE